jgi:hypothetical protein
MAVSAAFKLFRFGSGLKGVVGCRRGRGGCIMASCIHCAGEQPVARWACGQEASGGGAMKLLEEGDNQRTLC